MALKTNYEKNGKKYYRVTASVGRDANGKLIRKEFYGKSKKEAEEKRDKYINDINSGLNIDYKNINLGQLFHLWLFETIRVSDKIKPSTFERYEGIYRNYIKNSEIHGLILSQIKPMHLQRYYNKLYDNGKSSSVIKNLNKLMKTFFNYARDQGYVLINPCEGKKILIPGNSAEITHKENIEVFTDEEIKKIKDSIKAHRLKALYLLALGTGLRQGELLALKWDDINFTTEEVTVNKSIRQVNIISREGTKEYKTILQSPKSKTSNRIVPIPNSLIPILKQHNKNQKQEKLKAGSSYIDNNFVFTTELGKNINSRNLTRSYERLLKKFDIPYKKFHTFRHTYATKLFEANVPLKTVQTLLGHSDISITANIYTHVMPKEKTKAVEKLNSLFS